MISYLEVITVVAHNKRAIKEVLLEVERKAKTSGEQAKTHQRLSGVGIKQIMD